MKSELCGACQQWGCNPIIVDGKCETCGRTEQEIIAAHSVCYVQKELTMEITFAADTLHSVYRIPCNMEGEPEFNLRFKASELQLKVQLRYEVRESGEMKSVNWVI